jgi:hypothetical protein
MFVVVIYLIICNTFINISIHILFMKLQQACATLDIKPGKIDPSKIKSAFRKMARSCHPDTNRDDVNAANEWMRQVYEAYEFLVRENPSVFKVNTSRIKRIFDSSGYGVQVDVNIQEVDQLAQDKEMSYVKLCAACARDILVSKRAMDHLASAGLFYELISRTIRIHGNTDEKKKHAVSLLERNIDRILSLSFIQPQRRDLRELTDPVLENTDELGAAVKILDFYRRYDMSPYLIRIKNQEVAKVFFDKLAEDKKWQRIVKSAENLCVFGKKEAWKHAISLLERNLEEIRKDGQYGILNFLAMNTESEEIKQRVYKAPVRSERNTSDVVDEIRQIRSATIRQFNELMATPNR